MAESEPLVSGQPSDKASAEVRTKINKVCFSESFSTDGLLAHAEQQARDRHFEDYLIAAPLGI